MDFETDVMPVEVPMTSHLRGRLASLADERGVTVEALILSELTALTTGERFRREMQAAEGRAAAMKGRVAA